MRRLLRISRCTLFLLAALHAVSVPMQASPLDWNVTLSTSNLSGAPGSVLVFLGTIQNSTGADLFLDSAAIDFTTSLPASDYAKGFADDFLSTLGVIPVTGYSGALFYVAWTGGVTDGMGSGAFELTAESVSPSSYLSPFTASRVSSITPVAAPEPGYLLLDLLGFAGLVTMRGMHRRTREKSHIG